MKRASALAVLALMAATTAGHAQFTGPNPARGGVSGAFTLLYHGALADGTVCPPADSGAPFSLSGAMPPTAIRAVALKGSPDVALQATFATGSFCKISFEGSAVLAIHHGTTATLDPTKITDRQPHADDLLNITTLSGEYRVTYAPVMCVVAPCPPGQYVLSQDGRTIARTSAIIVEDLGQSPSTTARYRGQYLPFEWAFGTVRLPGGLGDEPPHFETMALTATRFGAADH